MGKNKLKRTKTGDKTEVQKAPKFDESALSALTEQIEKRIESPKAPFKSAEKVNGNYKQDTIGAKSKPNLSRSKINVSEQIRGKKRDAKGNVKGGNNRSAPAQGQKNMDPKDQRATLLEEILALGGTEEDLDLVADAASDDEEIDTQSPAAPDKSLKKELAKFVASLGIEGQAGAEASESEDGEEIEEEWEEASDVAGATEPDEEDSKTTQPTFAPNIIVDHSTKDPNRLVSGYCMPISGPTDS